MDRFIQNSLATLQKVVLILPPCVNTHLASKAFESPRAREKLKSMRRRRALEIWW